MLDRIADGRTDLVFDLLREGRPATLADENGTPLICWCSYYGDVSAIRFLLANGCSLEALGNNLGLSAAAFHGHWRLCEFLLEHGADPNLAEAETGERPLHAALCKSDRYAYELVVEVLLAGGAHPNVETVPGVETGAFMRDIRTCGETPLHRAAAYGTTRAIELLIAAGAKTDARDAHGESPLTWASRHLRPDHILDLLCFGDHRVHPDRVRRSREPHGRDGAGMEAYLLGRPHPPER